MASKLITCRKCKTILYSRDQNVLLFPWFKDDNGINHMGCICLTCGNIHDCAGRLSIGSFFGGENLTGFQSISLEDLDIKVKEIAEQYSANDKLSNLSINIDYSQMYSGIAEVNFRIPRNVSDALINHGLLNWSNS